MYEPQCKHACTNCAGYETTNECNHGCDDCSHFDGGNYINAESNYYGCAGGIPAANCHVWSNRETFKETKGDDIMNPYVVKANILDASIQNEFGPLDWADQTLYDDGVYMITFTGPCYSECCDENGNLNHIKLLALQDGFFAKMHNIKRMIENCGIKVISFSKIEASKDDPFAEAIIEIDFEGTVGVEL